VPRSHESDPHGEGSSRSAPPRGGGVPGSIRSPTGPVYLSPSGPYLSLMASPEIDALTQALARLPGLGPRSARRAVLHLLKKRETALTPLLRALERVS